MIFEALPTAPTADELLDQAFSRATRSGRAKQGVEAQQSMLQTASNVLSDNLRNLVTAWPDFDEVDPFYYEVADAVLRESLPGHATDAGETGVEALRASLSELDWAARKTKELGREYQGRLPNDTETARKLRKQGFARMASVVEEVGDDLAAVGDARNALRDLPDIRPDEPTIVVAGYPNVGKTSFLNAVTRASTEVASYPFTTRGVDVGHVERDHLRYQVVDTPGLLDRPADERNEIESQAVSAIEHLADVVLFFVDASGACGYPLDVQLALRDDLVERFHAPVLTVANKADRSMAVEADVYATVDETAADEQAGTADDDEPAPEIVDADGVLDAAVEAIDYEPELPFEES